jgi:hypothetical protein
MFADYLVATHE